MMLRAGGAQLSCVMGDEGQVWGRASLESTFLAVLEGRWFLRSPALFWDGEMCLSVGFG